MKKLYLNIVSPEKEIYNGEVESVTLPGTIGTVSYTQLDVYKRQVYILHLVFLTNGCT